MSISEIMSLVEKILLVPEYYTQRESNIAVGATLLLAVVGAAFGQKVRWPLLLALVSIVTFCVYWFYLYDKGGHFYSQMACRALFCLSFSAMVSSFFGKTGNEADDT
jgi:hypothetical protein